MAGILLFISTLLSFIFLCLFINALVTKSGESGTYMFILFWQSLICWGVIGCFVRCNSTSEIISPAVLKTKSAVIIEYDGIIKTYEDIKTYNAVNDSTKIKLITTYNMYGLKIQRYYDQICPCDTLEKAVK